MRKDKFIYTILLFLSAITFAQNKEFIDVNLDELIGETQVSNSSDDLEMVWWIPTEFWQVAFSRDKSVEDNEKELIVNMIKDYVFVVFVKGKIGVFGGVTYESKESIEENAKVFYNGNMLKQLKEKEIPSDLQNMIGFMKPMMKNMIGQMGENMQFIIFKNDKKSSVNSYDKGNLSFELFDFKPQIELPLGSLLIEKKCVDSNRLFSGKWNYCPFHGKELINQ